MLRRDPWLETFTGVESHRLVVDTPPGDDVLAELRAVLSWPSFVSAGVPTSCVPAVSALEDVGFRVVDVNVRLERALDEGDPSAARFATADDEEAVAAIARSSMRSRFHLDPRFPPGAANALKEAWARAFWRGERGRWMVVADDQQGPCGFLQLLDDGDRLVIDLVATADRARRRGVASSMIRFAEATCGDHATVVVGTQVGNIASLRLYEGMGFRVAATTYQLHAHGPR